MSSKKNIFSGRIAVVTKNLQNIFSWQLKKAGYNFEIFDPGKIGEISNFSPQLVLVVNLGAKIAETIKDGLPDSQVIICRGSKKAFDPSIIAVHGPGEQNHDYYFFSDWQNFLELIFKKLKPQKKLFRVLEDEPDKVFLKEMKIEDFDLSTERQGLFHQMLDVSVNYLELLLDWIEQVETIEFAVDFDYDTAGRKGSRKVRQLKIAFNEGQHHYRGRQVVNINDEVNFFSESMIEENRARVIEVNESFIIFQLQEAVSRKEVNNFKCFTVELNRVIIEHQLEICRKLLKKDRQNSFWPLDVLRGFSENISDGYFTQGLRLSRAEKKILKDSSQIQALNAILNGQPITCIEGAAGSGKTLISSVAIKNFFLLNKKVLVVSHSNQGLDVLFAAVAQSLGQKNHKYLFRLGNNPEVISSNIQKFHRILRFQKNEGKPLSLGEIEAKEVATVKKTMKQDSGIIIGVTLNSLFVDQTMDYLRKRELAFFDICFIDEATRGFLFETVYPYLITQEKVVNVGDHRQLSNINLPAEIVQELVSKGEVLQDIQRFNQGLFTTFMKKQVFLSQLLKVGRRSLKKIIHIVNAFYGDQLICGRFEPENEGRVIVYDTKDAQNAVDCQEKFGNSWLNPREANLVVKILVRLLVLKRVSAQEIGVITPYQAQIKLIRQKLRKAILFHKLSTFSQEQMEEKILPIVNTVDAFQGSERKIIILSLVRSNKEGDIGFNIDERRINVSLSRAQDTLIIVFNSNTFFKSDCPEMTKEALRRAIEIARQDKTYHLII